MKKKINVTFQVQYETEIEVDTDLPEGTYELVGETLIDVYTKDNLIVKTQQLEDMVLSIVESEVAFNIDIPENETVSYRKNSFEVVNIIV